MVYLMSNILIDPEHAHELAISGTPIQEVESLTVLNGDKYIREREGDFTDSRLKSKLGSIPVNQLILLPPEVSGIKAPRNGSGDDIHLTAIPGLELGRQKSRAEVKFGQLYIESDRIGPITELVAVKYVHPIPAIREMFASLAVNRRFGEQLAYDPLGFVKNPNGKVGYITRYEHHVTSLDNVLWSERSSSEQRTRAMAKAAVWMASLHNKGIIHGDAQAKNIAFNSRGLPRYIDLEAASDIKHGRLDTDTKRLLDISDLFDPESMKREIADDEMTHFAKHYVNSQDGSYPILSKDDVLDKIASLQQRPKN